MAHDLIRKDDRGQWCFFTKKYPGEPLEKVAQKDPGYLTWAHQNTTLNLPDDAYFSLEDAMRKYNIPYTYERKHR